MNSKHVMRTLTAFVVGSLAAASHAVFATITLDDPNKVVSPGSQSIWFSGSIDILDDNPGPVLFVYHAYVDGSYANKLDVNSYAQSYYNWLGTGAGQHAGDHYEGDLFELVVGDDDPAGLYNHRGSSLDFASTAYVYELGMNDPDHRSDEQPFTVLIVPEPATCVVAGLGLLGLVRRRWLASRESRPLTD